MTRRSSRQNRSGIDDEDFETANTTLPEVAAESDLNTSVQRRSSRKRRLNYQSFDTNWMTQDSVIRHREVEQQYEQHHRSSRRLISPPSRPNSRSSPTGLSPKAKRLPPPPPPPPSTTSSSPRQQQQQQSASNNDTSSSTARVTRSCSNSRSPPAKRVQQQQNGDDEGRTEESGQNDQDDDNDVVDEENGNEGEEDDEDDEDDPHNRSLPFYSNHVRFSRRNSVRRLRSSPPENVSRRSSRLSALQDEQSEFNRQYSRDLRSRRRNANSSSSPRQEKENKDENKGHEADDDDDDDDEEESENNKKKKASPPGSRLRRSLRSVRQRQFFHTSEEDDEEEEDEEDHRQQQEEIDDETNDESSLRRSSRRRRTIHKSKSSEDDQGQDSVGDEADQEIRKNQNDQSSNGRLRPRRCRLPVDRLNYSNENHRGNGRSRRCDESIRNLDQYSTDEEFKGSNETRRGRRNLNKYNMRENRTRTNRYEDEFMLEQQLRRERPPLVVSSSFNNRYNRKPKKKRRERVVGHGDRDSSSSSSSSSPCSDEGRFQERKTKRMAIERAKMMPLNMNKEDVTKSIFRERRKIGTSLADVSPMEMDMGVSFDSVGGAADHINSLKEMVMFPLLYPELFAKFSINPPRGVLFYGPPGTGKTLVARALACECSKEGRKVAFFMRKGADCLSKWIGESERQLRLLFDQAYLMRPSIIFFDEIDGLAPIRSSRQDQIHSSIVSTLLALMDGLDNRGEIIVIGATNRIDSIDPALRRPGRFDRELRFGLPTRDARKEIITLHSKDWDPPLSEETLNMLADKTIGYCGADLKGLCGEAALNALRRRYPQVYKSNQKLALDINQIKVTDVDFEKAMKSMVPSTHRVSEQFQSPLPGHIRPLLQAQYSRICTEIERIFPINSFRVSVFRPRLLIAGNSGHGQTTYLGPAVLHYLEKLPCQKLDIPALFSNSARSPEEALAQIIHEARRNLPGILYIPHIGKLWRTINDTVAKTFLSMVADIQPSAPLLILAVSEEPHDELPEDLSSLFVDSYKEVFALENPGEAERSDFFNPIFVAALANPVPNAEENTEAEEELPVIPIFQDRQLTEREEKRLRKKEDNRLRELRIFLRDIHAKINREQKFFMFRFPVDTEEVYDYLDTIKNPMDFERMLMKLDNGEYNCAQDFLDDIDLIAENAITYNSDLNYETNKIICHRARSLVDFCYALVKQEMDTDFEEECRDIVRRRKKLTEEIERMKKEEEEKKLTTANDTTTNSTTTTAKATAKRTGKKRVSRWAKGISPTTSSSSRNKKKTKTDEEEEVEDEEEKMEKNNDEEEAFETPLETPPQEEEEGNTNNDLIATGVRIDQNRLNSLKTELIRITKGHSVEKLERTYTKLMALVGKYTASADRTQLPSDLQIQIDALKAHNRQQQQHR